MFRINRCLGTHPLPDAWGHTHYRADGLALPIERLDEQKGGNLGPPIFLEEC